MHRRFLASFRHATRGLLYIWRGERNFRIHTLCAAVVLAFALLLGLTAVETGLLAIAIVFVLGAEILNTIVEDILDELHPDHHAVIGRVKDMVASLVMINAAMAALVGVLIFGPHLLGLF